jgi:DNA replication protein DnaC
MAIALAIRACLAGQRVLFRTATEWVALLADAQRQGRLEDELRRLERYPLLVCDEVGYIPFDPQAANLMFMLVSRRYERASLIVTSNKPFSAWGEIFDDDATAAAMIDRFIHHAEILSLKGDSYPGFVSRFTELALRGGSSANAQSKRAQQDTCSDRAPAPAQLHSSPH